MKPDPTFTPDQMAELFAFARARITEDRDTALRFYEDRRKVLEMAEKTYADTGRDPEQVYDPALYALLVADRYKDHPDYRAEWKRDG